MIHNEKLNLAILILISLLLSTYVFFRTYVISMDGAFQYIPMAKIFASGSFKAAIGFTGQQPLYSFLIASVSRLMPDFEVAGKLVSSLLGILMIFPVYFLGKKIFDQRIAFLSVIFLVIHPYVRRFSADVLKESTYLFFLAIAFWYSLKAFEREKIYWYLLIPFFSVIPYLVRPDGVEVLLVVFFYALFIKEFSAPVKRWKVILLLILSSSILFFPYLLYLRKITGEWTFSKAKSLATIFGLGTTVAWSSSLKAILYSLRELNLEIFARYHPLYIFLLIIGLWKRAFHRLKAGEGLLLSFCVLHYVVLFLLTLNLTDWKKNEIDQSFLFSGRHVLPLLLVSIYWVGEGFHSVYQWIDKKIESSQLLSHFKVKRKSDIILVALLVVISIIILPKTLKPQRYDHLTEKWAGIWIKNQSGKGMTIFTALPRVAYYADGNYEYVDFRKDVIDKVKDSMVEKDALYLVIRKEDAVNSSEKAEAIKKNFIEVIRYEEKGMENVIIYKRLQ